MISRFLCEQMDRPQFCISTPTSSFNSELDFLTTLNINLITLLCQPRSFTVRRKGENRELGITPAWPYLPTTMKSHSSRPEGKVWAPRELLRNLQSLVARRSLGPLTEVFPFSATCPCVSFSFCPYISHVSCVLSSSAPKELLCPDLTSLVILSSTDQPTSKQPRVRSFLLVNSQCSWWTVGKVRKYREGQM